MHYLSGRYFHYVYSLKTLESNLLNHLHNMESLILLMLFTLAYLAFRSLQQTIRNIEEGLVAETRKTQNMLKTLTRSLDPIAIELGPITRSFLDKNKVSTIQLDIITSCRIHTCLLPVCFIYL